VTGIRLLNVVPTLLCGGTENHFMTLARSLDAARFDLRFACLRKWGPFVDELNEARHSAGRVPGHDVPQPQGRHATSAART
jgi:hypothetical protein